jgi:hypothetical protein
MRMTSEFCGVGDLVMVVGIVILLCCGYVHGTPMVLA